MSNFVYGKAFFDLKESIKPEWHKFINHEFVMKISDGTLPSTNFIFYLKQDFIFLSHFSRAWALAVTKSQDWKEMSLASSTVQALVNFEMKLHINFCKKKGILEKELSLEKEAKENLAYTRYVLEAGYSGGFLDLIVCLMPCIIGYGEIGKNLSSSTSSVYADWIGTYSSEDYQKVCSDVGHLFDYSIKKRFGNNYKKLPYWGLLKNRFKTATELETNFWNMGIMYRNSK